MGQSIGTLLPLRLRLWLGSMFFRPLDSNIHRVSWHRVIKGPCDPPEIEAMQYVAAHTTVPVPKLYAVLTDDAGRMYIEMEYIRGETLGSAWERLSTGQKDVIFADLKQHIASLRALEPPSQDLVASALQNPAYDCRIGFRFFGPFSQDAFQSLARGHLRMEDVATYMGPDAVKVHTSRYRTCFTHGDLAPRNIMVRNGRVVAIIDWAFAGWYPEYWEFTKAHYSIWDDDWREYVRAALPCYETELAAECILWTRIPEPGSRSTWIRDDVTIEQRGSDPSAAWLKARAGRQLTDLWSHTLALEKIEIPCA